MGDSRDNLFKIKSTYYSLEFSYYDSYRNFLLKIKKDFDIGIYQVTGSSLSDNFDEKIINEIKTQFPDMFDPLGNTMIFPILRIDNNLIQMLCFQDEKGNKIELQTDGKGREEIAVGCELKPYIKIGDELIDSYSGTVYVVKYILADDQVWADGELLNNTNIVSLGNYIITPFDLKKCDSYDCASFASNVFLCINNDETAFADQKIELIEKQAEQNDIFIDICSMDEMEKNSLKDNNDEFKFCFLLAGIMIVTVAIIIIILSVMSWVSDYHDIGILYANGFTDKDIFRIIRIENTFKLLTSAVVSMAWINIRNWDGLMIVYGNTAYNSVVYAGIVLVYFAVLFFSSVVSFVLINRVSPCNLLKGEQL
ncbi:MAG: ABC transporter permease [Lachnospiraceae bacterium]|nr:ABC transporter permease [Lachnospiraceae bacterium]